MTAYTPPQEVRGPAPCSICGWTRHTRLCDDCGKWWAVCCDTVHACAPVKE